MLTKSANALIKQAILVPSLIGALRASSLTDEQKAFLRTKYHLSPDANLEARNAGRSLAGSLGGSAIGAALAFPALASRNPALAGLGLLTPFIGSLGGAWRASRKYSRGNPLLQAQKADAS